MGTRSRIILKTDKGYESIYCHWDGYPSHHLPILNEHYNTIKKAQELINLGSISSLAEKVKSRKNQVHTFDNPIKGIVVAYGRDRGETNVAKKVTATLKPHQNGKSWEEYWYLFKNGEWTYGQPK